MLEQASTKLIVNLPSPKQKHIFYTTVIRDKVHCNLTRHKPVPDVLVFIRIEIVTSVIHRSVFLVNVFIMVKAGTPQANIEKVISLGCTRLEPVVGDQCNQVARDSECHTHNDGHDQNYSPHREPHLRSADCC